MKSRVLTVAALLASIAACTYFILSSDPSPGFVPADDASQREDKAAIAHSGDALGKESASGNPSDAAGQRTAVNWKRFTALMGVTDGSVEPLPRPTREDIARFLAKCGESPANLVAAFEKTRDRRLLERALELFPNSPVVLMAAIESIPASAAPKPGETYRPDAERAAFIERFKAADPDNPLPWIFSAQHLFMANRTGEAIAEIREALQRPAFYTYANERMDSAQQLYQDMGLNSVEAGVFAMAGLTLPHMGAAQQASRSLMEWQKSAADSGDTAAAEDALRLTYDLGRTFATPEASRTLIGQLVGISMEARALKSLPADARPDWLAVAPAQRLGEMEKQKQDVRDLTAGLDWVMQRQDEPLLAEYLRRNRSDGELSALTWLKGQKK
jgi:hypothetical protein